MMLCSYFSPFEVILALAGESKENLHPNKSSDQGYNVAGSKIGEKEEMVVTVIDNRIVIETHI